jgi:hypothetical protein
MYSFFLRLTLTPHQGRENRQKHEGPNLEADSGRAFSADFE